MRFQFKFSSNSSPKIKYIFHPNMVNLWSKCPIQKLWQIFKSIFMPNFTFFGCPQYFSYFYSLLLIYSIRKRIELGKITVCRFLRGWPSSALPRPNPSGKADPCRLLPWDAAKRDLAPRGPHTSASLLRGRKPLST
jgi:hypothetical protein